MEYYQILIIIIGLVVLIGIISLALIFIRKKKKIKEIEEFPELLEALGGKENITEISSRGSRVSVIVDNKRSVDKEKIKEQGVETIVISNKKVTLVVGNKKASLIANYLNEKN